MPTADRVLMLKLLGDTASIDKSLRVTQGRLRSTAAAAGSWMKAAGIGLAIEGVAQLTDALGDAWTGFREGEKASAQLATTWDNFNVKGADLQETIDAISASALKLGTDDTEAINAFNKALQATGGDSSAAMKRLRIAQDLVANGSAPNLSSAMKLIQQAGNGSKRVVDQFGLTAETAGGRIKQLGEKVKKAADKAAAMDPVGVLFANLNDDLEGIVGSLASGDLERGMKAFEKMGTDVATAWGKIDAQATPALDNLTGGSFSDARSDLDGLIARIGDLGDAVGPKFGEAWSAFTDALRGLQPIVEVGVTALQPFISLASTHLSGLIGLVNDSATGAFTVLAELLRGDVSGAFDALGTAVGNILGDLDDLLLNIPSKLVEALPDIQFDAAAIGSAIWDGIVGGISDLAARLGEIMDGAVTTLRNAWNGLDFAIPAFALDWAGYGVDTPMGRIEIVPPGHFQVFEGTGDLIPDFKDGGIVKARPGGLIGRLAEAGRDEAVIPLDRLGGMLGGADTVHHVHSGTVRLDITQGAAGALRAAGYTPADIAELSARLEHQNRMQSVAYARMAGED